MATARHDTAYEWKAVALLSLGFGLVGLDRFMVIPLFPTMSADLGLDYSDLGLITGALAITWGLSSIFVGRLADRIGQKRVLIGSLVIFSILAGFHGLAAGVAGLVVIRALMGVFEGAFTPAAIVATLGASHPKRLGRNLGLQQAALPLFGLALAPIFVTQMLHFVEWRWIFLFIAAPGFVIAALIALVIRQRDVDSLAARSTEHDTASHSWKEVFAYRNVRLNIIGMFCWLTCLIVTSAMTPSYLIDFVGLAPTQMGFVLSAIGFGAAAGDLVMPTLSDRIGRKRTMIIGVLGAFVFTLLIIFGAQTPVALFIALFGACFFIFSLMCLTVGPLTTEAVPARLMTTATGMVVGFGEIFGGGIAPIVGGYVAESYGIQAIYYLSLVALVIGIVVVLGLKETLLKDAPDAPEKQPLAAE